MIGTQSSKGNLMFCIFYAVVNLVALLVSPYEFNVGFFSLAAGNIVFRVVSKTKNSAFTWFLGVAFGDVFFLAGTPAT